MEKQYLSVMLQSLEKKSSILDAIMVKNDEQTGILKDPEMKWDDFDANANEKIVLIDEMEKLDDGFEELFQRVKEELASPGGQEKYAMDIKKMQELIRLITEKSVSIQAQEARNKTLVEQYFKQTREKIRMGRTSSKVAGDYYRNMRKTSYMESHFLDSKK